MSNLKEFTAYAGAFEQCLQDDDWSRLEQYFAADSICLPRDGSEAHGRDNVIQALQDSVATLEKKCDTREAIGQPGVSEEGDTVLLTYVLKYGKAGVGEFILTGKEMIEYENGLIVRMEDVFEDPAGLAAWRAKI